ncbi:MAG: type secretion protein [Hyphomicrobiales bacterium]
MTSPLESIRQTIAVNTVTSPVGSEAVAERQGTYRGEIVKTSAQNSKISQAKQLPASRALDTNPKTLSMRSVRQGQATHMQATSRIGDFYDKLPNMPNLEAVQALVDTFQSFAEIQEQANRAAEAKHGKEDTTEPEEEDAGETRQRGEKSATKEDLLEALQQFDRDATHQFAALDMAREYFSAENASPEFQTLLDEAMAEYEKPGIAAEVRAGFMAAQEAARAAATLGTDPQAYRDAFRLMMREVAHMGQLFDAVVKFDLLKKLDEVIDSMKAVVGRELANANQSTDALFLHALITELQKLKKISSVLTGAAEVIRLTDRLLPRAERSRVNSVQLTSLVLHFSAKPAVNLADARLMLGPLERASPESQVMFANALRDLHSVLPDELMPSAQARLQQNATIGALLNQLVAAEEAAYEAQAARG